MTLVRSSFSIGAYPVWYTSHCQTTNLGSVNRRKNSLHTHTHTHTHTRTHTLLTHTHARTDTHARTHARTHTMDFIRLSPTCLYTALNEVFVGWWRHCLLCRIYFKLYLTIKGKIRTFFKCIYYKAYSMTEIIPH